MLAKDLISDTVPSLHTSDNGAKALSLMEIFRVSHLPIVNNTEFLGLISDNDIYDLNSADEPIGNHTLSLQRPFAKKDQHVFEVLDIAAKQDLSVIPVLDEKNGYMGVITLRDLVKHLAEYSAIKQPGGIIILEMNQNDYSPSQIAQIIESNDAKILSLFVSNQKDSTQIEVTIKINKTDIAGILQTFNRFNYQVKATYSEDEKLEDIYNDRFEMLIKYLNV
jgi:acetoin utilization protein AcuB